MNWLSQMIHTPIDLDRMYPAERPTQGKSQRAKNFEVANDERSNRARDRYLKAMGGDRITAEQLFSRLKESGAKVKNSHAVRRMLSRMMVDGLVNKTVPSGHKSVTWVVVED